MTLAATFMGAEGRYEDYVYLQMLQREWQRPIVEFEGFSHFPDDDRPSSRAAFVLLFWGYFESKRTAIRVAVRVKGVMIAAYVQAETSR